VTISSTETTLSVLNMAIPVSVTAGLVNVTATRLVSSPGGFSEFELPLLENQLPLANLDILVLNSPY